MLSAQRVLYIRNRNKKQKQNNRVDTKGSIDSNDVEEAKEKMPDNQVSTDQAREQTDPIGEGYHEAVKEVVKEGEKHRAKLDDLVDKSSKVLFKATTAGFFDLFPDRLTIDTEKVNIIYREFWASGRVHSIFIKNISDVFIDTDLIRAALTIVDMGFVDNSVTVRNLKKNDAIRARRIIQGLVVATKNDIDLSKIDDGQLVAKIEELGKIHEQAP